MENLCLDHLYQLLLQSERHPQLLFAEKSLLALDNYIAGYLAACSFMPNGDHTQQWYHLFCLYVLRHFGESEDPRDIRAVILAHGYDDTSGVDCFFALLKEFSQSTLAEPVSPSELSPQEVRALRFSAKGVCALAQREICAYPERYFGLDQNKIACTICYDFSCGTDGSMLCLAYDRAKTVVTTASISKKLHNIPVIEALRDRLENEPYNVINI